MFKLLLTVFLGVCVGAVVADLLFGPDQPATPSPDSQGQHWEPWRSWYLAARRQSRQTLAAVVGWAIAAAQAVDRAARRFARWTVATVQLVPDTLRSLSARRRAVAERTAAHARHVAHLETVTPWHDPLPPPVAPPLHPQAMTGLGGVAGVPGPNGSDRAGPAGLPGPTGPPGPAGWADPASPTNPGDLTSGLAGATDHLGLTGLGSPVDRASPGDPAAVERPPMGPPMGPPAPVGPPVPASLRGQELVETSEIPVDGGLREVGETGGPGTFEPLGRPPWDALVRRPMPSQAPTPSADGPRQGGRGRRSRRDPLDWEPRNADRPPDPEWDAGAPGPLTVPLRVRARSAAVLLALTGVFGVITAAAVLVALVMAVGALDKL